MGMEEPESDCAIYHIVVSGHAWIQVGDDPIKHLKTGDITVIPHGDA